MTKKTPNKQGSWLSKIILGFVVAATGVGAGDLITASLAGTEFHDQNFGLMFFSKGIPEFHIILLTRRRG